ncbi:MAG: FAD-binding protein, partial [Chitinophagia bacterium]|nr:FAD-binding protein [Chitinophagia bacterium]
MTKDIVIAVPPAVVNNENHLKQVIAATEDLPIDQITGWQVLKKSLDGRAKQPLMVLKIRVFINEPLVQTTLVPEWKDVHNAPPVLIIGAGPAGLFAALQLIKLGVKPIIIERGKDVRSRRRDLAALNKQGILNLQSNYCFGEGGAGTYSDGKLYTRSTKRGNVNEILELFVHFGAEGSILYEAHPHIGTNKLPGIISQISHTITECGGEIYFNKQLTDIIIVKEKIKGIRVHSGEEFTANALILATGHSANDIYQLLQDKKIAIEAKPFAVGVRVEHPQYIIDKARYRTPERGEALPPASYSLTTQTHGRGVFSFCMCPGGIIAPASTQEGTLVVNGWSPSKRNNPYANSGIVATVDIPDFEKAGFTGALAGLQYREAIEKSAFTAGGGHFKAPAERLTHFVAGTGIATLPSCSYVPGIVPAAMDKVLPLDIAQALRHAFIDFGNKLHGYYTSEAVVVATESR